MLALNVRVTLALAALLFTVACGTPPGDGLGPTATVPSTPSPHSGTVPPTPTATALQGDDGRWYRVEVLSKGGLITGAALIMVAVFSGFAAGQFVSTQQMGFGLAFAIFIDATIVRSVLVPATMQLLGERNWYFPRFLQWVPRIGIEGAAGEAGPPPSRIDP